MGHRSWGMFRASVAIAAPVCLALSTQILFQRSLYREWPVSEIAYAWARGLADLAIVAACIVAALNLAYLIPARRMVSKALLFAAGMVGGAILGEWIVLSVQWGALAEMRARHTTLGHEVDLIAAYLEVLRVRMGSRLAFEIDVPAGLRDHLVPPLSLATLVENAIKHGLSELPEGGRVTVRARVESGALSILIADTGGGFTKAGRTGPGLPNLRLRLRGLYRDAAALTPSQNTPRGLAAMLPIPTIQANTDIAHIGH